jgi:hypothetical protein
MYATGTRPAPVGPGGTTQQYVVKGISIQSIYDWNDARMKKIIIANDICELTPDLLRGRGIRAVLSDLDNTLAGYRANVPDKEAEAWIKSLKDALIPLFIVSNAGEKRVAAFCGPLELPYAAKARKPHAHCLLEALEHLKVGADEAVMVGDQYRTDVKAARNAGMRVVLVPPRVKGFFFTLRRRMENPFIRRHLETL